MLDTIKMYLPYESMPPDSLQHVPGLLTDVKETTHLHTGNTSIIGRLRNLSIRLNSYAMVIEGSMTKYWYGNNWRQLSFGEMQQAFSDLSEELQLSLEKAVITRIDLGINLTMEHHVSLYLGNLDYCPRYDMQPLNNGIYFNQKQKQLLFYGKEAEQKSKGNPIPSLYRGKNILRYEMRWKKGLAKQHNVSQMNIETLCQERFFVSLVNKMKNEYFKIRSRAISTLPMEAFKSPKSVMDHLLLKGAEAEFGSVGEALSFIDKVNKSGAFANKMQAVRLKQKIKVLSKKPGLTQANELTIELDAKITQALSPIMYLK